MADRKRLTPAERAKELREKNLRKPIGGLNLRLPIAELNEKGWSQHWFNATPERIKQAEAAGYEKVTQEDIKGTFNSDSTGEIVRSNGSITEETSSSSILMKIPTEIAEEDRRTRANATHEKWIAQIHNNQLVGDAQNVTDKNNFFNPDAHKSDGIIKIG
jgi:hypothetical protein